MSALSARIRAKISYITLRDPDIQVNVKTETVAADALPKADQLKLTATKFVTALAKDDENWRDVRAVGALCGVNTGTLENCALTRGRTPRRMRWWPRRWRC